MDEIELAQREIRHQHAAITLQLEDPQFPTVRSVRLVSLQDDASMKALRLAADLDERLQPPRTRVFQYMGTLLLERSRSELTHVVVVTLTVMTQLR